MELTNNKLAKFREEEKKLAKELKKQTIGYILAALSLVAGLAWNQAIQSLVKAFFPSTGGSILVDFLYAIIITVIIVIVTLYLLKFQDKKEDEQHSGDKK